MNYFLIFSPTVLEWQATVRIAQDELLNAKEAMQKVLVKVREDVDKQFDEKQAVWKPLAPYTIKKKQALKADMRILHETNSSYSGQDNQRLRLRDAYAQTGSVNSDGWLIYTYPPEKPYAKDHQQGIAGVSGGRRVNRGPNARERSQLQKELDRLDLAFDRMFD